MTTFVEPRIKANQTDRTRLPGGKGEAREAREVLTANPPMARSSANRLTPEQREAALTKISQGMSYAECADWLKRVHKAQISKQALGALVKKHRVERSEVSKTIARNHIAKTLPADLTACDDRHAETAKLLDSAIQAAKLEPSCANYDKVKKTGELFLKFEELKRKTLGLDQPDEIVQTMADFLARA